MDAARRSRFVDPRFGPDLNPTHRVALEAAAGRARPPRSLNAERPLKRRDGRRLALGRSRPTVAAAASIACRSAGAHVRRRDRPAERVDRRLARASPARAPRPRAEAPAAPRSSSPLWRGPARRQAFARFRRHARTRVAAKRHAGALSALEPGDQRGACRPARLDWRTSGARGSMLSALRGASRSGARSGRLRRRQGQGRRRGRQRLHRAGSRRAGPTRNRRSLPAKRGCHPCRCPLCHPARARSSAG